MPRKKFRPQQESFIGFALHYVANPNQFGIAGKSPQL